MILIVAVPIIIDIEMSRSGLKTRHQPRSTRETERQGAAFATRKDTSSSKMKMFRTRLRAESSNSQTTFENLHEGEN